MFKTLKNMSISRRQCFLPVWAQNATPRDANLTRIQSEPLVYYCLSSFFEVISSIASCQVFAVPCQLFRNFAQIQTSRCWVETLVRLPGKYVALDLKKPFNLKSASWLNSYWIGCNHFWLSLVKNFESNGSLFWWPFLSSMISENFVYQADHYQLTYQDSWRSKSASLAHQKRAIRRGLRRIDWWRNPLTSWESSPSTSAYKSDPNRKAGSATRPDASHSGHGKRSDFAAPILGDYFWNSIKGQIQFILQSLGSGFFVRVIS